MDYQTEWDPAPEHPSIKDPLLLAMETNGLASVMGFLGFVEYVTRNNKHVDAIVKDYITVNKQEKSHPSVVVKLLIGSLVCVTIANYGKYSYFHG